MSESFRQKEAEFDAQGRPYQPFFYTLNPDLYSRLYRLRDSIDAVTIFGDRLSSQGKRPDKEQVPTVYTVQCSTRAVYCSVHVQCTFQYNSSVHVQRTVYSTV